MGNIPFPWMLWDLLKGAFSIHSPWSPEDASQFALLFCYLEPGTTTLSHEILVGLPRILLKKWRVISC